MFRVLFLAKIIVVCIPADFPIILCFHFPDFFIQNKDDYWTQFCARNQSATQIMKLDDKCSTKEILIYKESQYKALNNVVILRTEHEDPIFALQQLVSFRDNQKKVLDDSKKQPLPSSAIHIKELSRTQEFIEEQKRQIIMPKDILFALKCDPVFKEFYESCLMEMQLPKG